MLTSTCSRDRVGGVRGWEWDGVGVRWAVGWMGWVGWGSSAGHLWQCHSGVRDSQINDGYARGAFEKLIK
jgi:hypothetical protein